MFRKIVLPLLLVVFAFCILATGTVSPVQAQSPTLFGKLDVLFQILDAHKGNDGLHVAFDIQEANGSENLGYTKVFFMVDPVVDLELGSAISISLLALGVDADWIWGPSSPYALNIQEWPHISGGVLTVSDIYLMAETYGFEVHLNPYSDATSDVTSLDWLPPTQKTWFYEFNLHGGDWSTVETFTWPQIKELVAQQNMDVPVITPQVATGNQLVPAEQPAFEAVPMGAGPTTEAHSGDWIPTSGGSTTLTYGIGFLALILLIVGGIGLVAMRNGNGNGNGPMTPSQS